MLMNACLLWASVSVSHAEGAPMAHLPGSSNDTTHVHFLQSMLFIGNSYTYYNDLPEMLQAFGSSANNPQLIIEHESFYPGGSSLAGNAASPEVLALIASTSKLSYSNTQF
jgi:hypothetical protein